jgi:[glutamine synthetase] adenylyltransferase / [glutamine synthetase]-adenylyl-L-tyrosine phosphorylase
MDGVAAGALDPDRVRTALARLSQVWPADYPALEGVIERFPAGREAVAALLAVSPVSAEKIIRDPAALLWLSHPEICASERGPRRMLRDLGEERPAGFDPQFRALRRVKNREMLRIALRDVARLSSLEQTTYEISCVADLCAREVCEGWLGEFGRRWGRPDTGFCVIGMGKLGGWELNYSSDIDVIFLYGEDGALNPGFTYHEFFTRLAEKITSTFAAASPDGALFRIDIRLRPEGGSGPLVRSLESMENYYAGYGETWERMALMKARGVAGSEELFYEFTHRLQPFIYPRSLSPDALDEVAAIKRRIERDIVGEAGLELNVKLGRGGIREIEFVAQALQLLHGARHAFLQERNTLKALRALQQLDFVDGHDVEALTAAYRFLRDVEHRLQIAEEKQTHTLPEPGPARLALARSLGFPDAGMFDATLLLRTTAVRAIFDKFLHGDTDRIAPVRDLAFFQDAAAAEKELAELGRNGGAGHVSPRTRKLSAKLEPVLLDGLRCLADPDLALHGFVRFVERYGIRGLLFESLVTNPRLLELLLRLFDSSRFLTDIVLRRPQLIEETTRTGSLGRELDVAAHLLGLARREENLTAGDSVRVYRRAQILRIALRDILGFADVSQVQREYTALAEACLLYMQRGLGLDETLTVVAMGKFGGGELSYGCDLDVVFIGDDPARAAELVKAMTAQTGEGIVFPVDARLRPEGASGLLAMPLESYRQYFQTRAQLWEAQALTKARPISGPAGAAFSSWARECWAAFGKRDDVLAGIREMHERVVRERAGRDGLLAFKTGVGGLMELEFHVQALQMRHGVWEQNTVRALSALADGGVIEPEAAAERGADYQFLRRCEAVIRRVDNSSVSTLPAMDAAQRQIAIRMGYTDRETFLTRYQGAREAIHAWCLRIE